MELTDKEDRSLFNQLTYAAQHHDSAKQEYDSPWGSLSRHSIPNLEYMAFVHDEDRTKTERQLDYRDNSHLYIEGLACRCGNPDARWSGQGTQFRPRCNDCMLFSYAGNYSHYAPQTAGSKDVAEKLGISCSLAPVQMGGSTGGWDSHHITDEKATKLTNNAIERAYIEGHMDMQLCTLLDYHEAELRGKPTKCLASYLDYELNYSFSYQPGEHEQ